MLTKKLSVALAALVMAGTVSAAFAAPPDPSVETRPVCHMTGNGSSHLIGPDNSSYDTHLNQHQDEFAVDGKCPGEEPDPEETVVYCIPTAGGGSVPVSVREGDAPQFETDNPTAVFSEDGTCEDDPAPEDTKILCEVNDDGGTTPVIVPDSTTADGVELIDPTNGRCPGVPGEKPPTGDPGCSNANTGISVLQSCDLNALLAVLNLGKVDQSAGGGSGSGGSNTNSGLSVAQLTNTILSLSSLNLGWVTQSVAIP